MSNESEADVLERQRVRRRRGEGKVGDLWALPRGEKAWTSGED